MLNVKKILEKLISLWNVYGGIIFSTTIAWFVDFSKASMDNITSYIILTLSCISVLTFFKLTIFKKKSNGLVDVASMSQQSVKAMNTAIDPVHQGEEMGKLIVRIYKFIKRKGKKVMKKLKEFFSRFKGYLLTFLLGVLALIEEFGGYINAWLGDKLEVNGVNVLPTITLVCATIVGCISNGRSKTENEKFKEFKSKPAPDELVFAEIEKTLKADEAQVKEMNKNLDAKKAELVKLNATLATVKNTYEAKYRMSQMTPQLATQADVTAAFQAVHNAENDIIAKQGEIDKLTQDITIMNTTINALKNQL